ncbi:MAG: MATE family efflux transporter [Desulfitobacteriaceae bacterium]
MGQHAHLENEKISALLFKYSIPSIIAMIVNALYNIVDRIYVGQGIGTLGLAGVTICFPLMNIILAFTLLAGVGGAVLISINLGRQDKQTAEKVLGNSLILLILSSVIIMAVCFLNLNGILRLFGASEDVLPFAREYFQIILIGAVFQSIGSGLNHSIRTDGKPKLSMLVMLIGVVLNIILAPIFIFVFKLGVAGAAIATVLSQAVTAFIALYYFTKGKSTLKIRKANFRLNKNYVLKMLAIGSAPFASQLATSLINIVLNRRLGLYSGDTAVSAMGAVSSIALLLMMPVFGLNQGLQPILGYNYGAHRYDRVKDVLKLTALWATLITTVGFVLIYIFSEPLVRMFSKDDANLVKLGVEMLKIYLLGMPVVGFQLVGSGCFSAIGKPKQGLFLSLLRQLVVLVPMVYILSSLLGYKGILFAGPISDALAFLITGVFAYRELERMSARTTKQKFTNHEI